MLLVVRECLQDISSKCFHTLGLEFPQVCLEVIIEIFEDFLITSYQVSIPKLKHQTFDLLTFKVFTISDVNFKS
jgi:hypothetical protein